MKRQGGRGRRKTGPRGTALVEAAIVAPIMLMGTLGIAEVGYVYMAKQTVTLAAREGARAGCIPGATSSDASNAASSTMNHMGLTGYSVSVNMGSDSDPTCTVTVTLPFSEASFTGSLFGGRTLNLTSSASMRLETGTSGGS